MSFNNFTSFDPSCFFTEGFDNNYHNDQNEYSFIDYDNKQSNNSNHFEFEVPDFPGLKQNSSLPEPQFSFADFNQPQSDFEDSKEKFNHPCDFQPNEEELIPGNEIDVQRDEFFFNTDNSIKDIQPEKPAAKKITIFIEIDDEIYEKLFSQNSNQTQGTVTTKEETSLNPSHESDTLSFYGETNYGDTQVELHIEWRNHIENYLKGRSEDEKNYIYNNLPNIFDAIREASLIYQPTINQDMIQNIIKDLVYSKECMLLKENKLIKTIVNNEIEEISTNRPPEMIDSIDLYEAKRKNKKVIKGNINHSNLNHLNENYVSNVFQFSKFNFPEDKDVQKIANTRNVSATNFKKLTKINLDDSVMVRKAKVRIVSSGKELVSNIEYWMNDGYFDQCNDREKYIQHKEKALHDLVLERQI